MCLARVEAVTPLYRVHGVQGHSARKLVESKMKESSGPILKAEKGLEGWRCYVKVFADKMLVRSTV